MGAPSFPFAELLVFWGGVQQGFDALAWRPIDSATHVGQPTLLLNGDADPWVRVEEAEAIMANLRGRKKLHFFKGLGHQSFLRHQPEEWRATVDAFLSDAVSPVGTRVVQAPAAAR
jgi:alpha-beta hydrolase superfamily lysophospholipase